LGKAIGSEAVPKNSQHWSWGDVGQQTVPEVASSHRRRTYAVTLSKLITPVSFCHQAV